MPYTYTPTPINTQDSMYATVLRNYDVTWNQSEFSVHLVHQFFLLGWGVTAVATNLLQK